MTRPPPRSPLFPSTPLFRSGVVDARLWRALANARTPIPRYAQPASHLEVDKSRQVLYVVRGSRVALVVPVSTARSEEHTSELQSPCNLVCRLLLEKKNDLLR